MGFDIQRIILAMPVILFSLTVHEYFHAWMANRFGDSTAKDMGRLTLNPIAHLDVMGTLMFFATQFRFGWAKPVPVNHFNLRNPRRDDLWIAAAGPLSNFALALIAGLLFRIFGAAGIIGLYEWLDMLLFYGLLINCSLGFFNLLPLHPLDGSHILRGLVPEEYQSVLDQVDRIGPIVLMVLIFGGLFFGISVIWMVLGPFVRAMMTLFSGIQM